MKQTCLVTILLLALLSPVRAATATPAQELDTYLNKVFDVVHEYDGQSLDEPAKRQFLKRLSGMASDIFDFRIMARMSLAKQWRSLSESQRNEYVRLFTDLLENTYFGKILKYIDQIQKFSRQDISIVDQIVYSAHRAEVRTVIVIKDTHVPINYRFVSRDGPWRIYDISLENISLIQNYRSQFKGVLQSRSSEEFLAMLRDKTRQTELVETSEAKRGTP
jgi:phospholipid transport system substrate-binding protein